MNLVDGLMQSIMSSLDGSSGSVIMCDDRLQILKDVTIDYFVNDKDMCEGMMGSHIQGINTVDELELYIQQQYSVEDLLSIYKRAFMHG